MLYVVSSITIFPMVGNYTQYMYCYSGKLFKTLYYYIIQYIGIRDKIQDLYRCKKVKVVAKEIGIAITIGITIC